MHLDNIEIPYGAYWSTPFTKWQGSFQHLHSIQFAAYVAKHELAKRKIEPSIFSSGILGTTNAQFQSFNGAPWPLYEIGATHTPGHMLSQVCATGARVLFAGASEVALGLSSVALLMTADRCSNGPHLYYPAPGAPGGKGVSEDQIFYNMMNDPVGGHSMMQTAENVASKYGISKEELDEVTFCRYEQYQDALKFDQAFQKRYMSLPFDIPKENFKGLAGAVSGDEGVFPITKKGLAGLNPIAVGGVVTYGSQTHPADGNAAIIITSTRMAKDLSSDFSIKINVCGFGQARADLGYMPVAPIEAAKKALDHAGLSIDQIKAIKTHNPFAVNDVVFARLTGVNVMSINNYGCSLIWGHPQGPTGMRAIIELIEELVILGGGYGLFTGCAAGDTSMAVVIRVSER